MTASSAPLIDAKLRRPDGLLPRLRRSTMAATRLRSV